MTDTNENIENFDTENEMPDELALLKQRADMLGIAYKANIGLETLKRKVSAAMEGTKDDDDETEEEVSPAKNSTLTKAQREAAMRREIQTEAMKLVRLRITNLNPSKKDLHGEIFTVANKYIGNVRKFIPYGEVTENGYHVPNCIYQQMKARKFLDVKTRMGKDGQIKVSTSWAQEFALEVLPQLSKEELKDLAMAQAAAGGL